ncbi:MAG: MFS transporter [Gammaproteobacteria bacterium]|nr:MFS transporter [Gammaproteobacteria bacterium]
MPTPTTDHKNTAETVAYPSAKRGYYFVTVMTVAMVFAFIDRAIPTMLVEPIKADLGLIDSQLALLGGVAFSIFYAIMALPIGYAVDRMSRTAVIGTGVITWSFMTTLAGFANSFAKLFGARIGVAVGEAVIAPTSVSLVGDYFPPEKQGRALGIISAGAFAGSGVALVAGGLIIDHLTEMGGLTLPVLGYFKPWQGTFLIVGIPGIFVGIAAYLIREPRRLDAAPAADSSSTRILQHLKEHRAALLLVFGGYVFMSMMGFSFAFWAPAMMVRTFDLSLAEVGVVLGTITIVCSTVGAVMAGTIADFVQRRGYVDAPARTAFFIALLMIPFAVLFPIVPEAWMSWVLIAIYSLIGASLTPLALLSVSELSTSRIKGRMTALYTLVIMIFGMSVGPQLTAFFTDFVFARPDYLSYAMSITAAIVLPVSALLLGLSLPKFRESARRLAASENIDQEN